MSKSKEILTFAKSVIGSEAEAVLSLTNRIDDSFEKAVLAIMAVPPAGRVVVSGVGKAGFVGMKLSATLASTGTHSFFLHPAEAVHGDLGRYSASDLVIVLSNSGETPEILKILPSIKRVGCPIISITATKESSLGKHSDIVLEIGNIEEVCPLRLSPTTTTTVMLALGDALAMTVLEERGFTKEDFAFYHPGGSLGRKLMTVSELMRQDEENAIATSAMTIKEVIHLISVTKGRPGAAAIVDSNGKLAGVFTDGDLRRCLEKGYDFLNEPISSAMGKSPKTCRPDQLVEEALRVMSQYKIDQLVVVNEDNKPIGTLDIQDIASIS